MSSSENDPRGSEDLHREGAREVARRLREAGFEAYLAGGCVRDLLRGGEPKDWDITTNARPPEVTKLFRRTVQVGAAFGVVRVLLNRDREYEVATYREDGGYSDGRHPDEVRYSTSKEEDVKRRDFTINALLMDPETGEVLDFVGGREDLARGLIRAVGEPARRFEEDRLRMLRAVRFAARFGFEIEPETFAVLCKEASAIRVVSVERIAMELEGVFAAADPRRGLALSFDTGLFAAIFPAHPAVTDPAVRAELLRCFERLPAATAALSKAGRVLVAWAALLDRLSGDALEAELRGLKLSRGDLRTVQRLVELEPLLFAPEAAREAERVRALIDPDAALFRALLTVRVGADAPVLARWADEAERLAERPLPPLPVLRGEDLKALGLTPGPHFKELLAAVEVEVLERRLTTKDEAITFVRGRLATSPGS